MSQGKLDLGAGLDDIIDTLVAGLDGDVPKPYRVRAETKAQRTSKPFPARMSTPVQAAVTEVLHPHRAYEHQLVAWEALYGGRSVVLTTPTASGKTLAFNPPILDAVLGGASALFVYPLVDLATSQADALRRLLIALAGHRAGAMPAVFERHSSAADNRADLGARREYVLTTPESLHRSLLPNAYPNTRSFFQRLRFVVLDEAHMYAGIFGSNMALILRRLAHRCLREGGRIPQFVVCSATIRDPAVFVRKLLPPGAPEAVLIERSSARVPRRHELALLSARSALVDLLARLVAATVVDDRGVLRPLRTICFVRSRREVEELESAVKRELRAAGHGELDRLLIGYKGGKGNAPRLFRELAAGTRASAITTNKLMAGIDIGDLDVAVVWRLQRRLQHMRQMFGRAGRCSPGAWIFVGLPASDEDRHVVDSFPDVFECREPEESIINLTNPVLLKAHLRCLGAVLGPSYQQEGPAHRELVERLFGPGLTVPPVVDGQPPWEQPPVDGIQIRGATGARNYVLYLSDAPRDMERDTVPERIAFRDHHPGAVFELEEKVYEVAALDGPPELRIRAQRRELDDVRTRCVPDVVATCTKVRGSSVIRGLPARFGDYHICESYARYDLLRMRESWVCPVRGCAVSHPARGLCSSHGKRLRETREWKREDTMHIATPLIIELDTVGVEFELEGRLPDGPTASGGAARASQRSSRAEIVSGTKAILLNSFPDAFSAEDDILAALVVNETSVLLYDNFHGGLGACEAIFGDTVGRLFDRARERVDSCRCRPPDGCIQCVQHHAAIPGDLGRKNLVSSFLARLPR